MIYCLTDGRVNHWKDFCSAQSWFGCFSANVLGLASCCTFNRWWLCCNGQMGLGSQPWEDRNSNRAFRSKAWVSNQIGCLLVLWKSGAEWRLVVKRYQVFCCLWKFLGFTCPPLSRSGSITTIIWILPTIPWLSTKRQTLLLYTSVWIENLRTAHIPLRSSPTCTFHTSERCVSMIHRSFFKNYQFW